MLEQRNGQGVVSKEHIHIHIGYPPRVSVSDLVKRLKGRISSRTSKRRQDEFLELKKRYWGRPFWATGAMGYGVWSTGNITDERVQEYLAHHRNPSNGEMGNIILV